MKLKVIFILAILLAGCSEEIPEDVTVDLVSLSEAATAPDINFAETTFSPDIEIGNITTVALTIWDTLTLDTGGFADPFTIVLDGVEKQFTHEEFKWRLGFIEDSNCLPER